MFPSSQKYDCSPPARPSLWARLWAQGREAWQEVLPHGPEAGTASSDWCFVICPPLWLLQICKKSGGWLCVSLDSACSLLTICPGGLSSSLFFPRGANGLQPSGCLELTWPPRWEGAGAEEGASAPSWQPLQLGLGDDIQGSHAGYPELCSLPLLS